MKSISLTENEINHIRETYSQELEKLQKRSKEINEILTKLKGSQNLESPSGETNAQKKQDNILDKPSRTLKNKKKVISSGKTAKVDVTAIQALEEKPKAKRGRPAKQKTEMKNVSSLPKNLISPKPNVKGIRGRKPKAKELVADQPKKAKKAITVVKTAKAEKLAKPAKVKKAVAKSVTPAKRGRKKSENSKKSLWTASILEILGNESKVLSSRKIIDQLMTIQKIPAADLSKTRSIVNGSLSDLKLKTNQVKSISVPGQRGEVYGLSQWFDEGGKLIDQFR